MTTIDGLDLVSPERYAEQGYPHEQWAALRQSSPITWFEPEGYQGFWAITRHADIVEISRKPDLFWNGPRLNIQTLERDVRNAQGPPLRTIVNMDPPDHVVYRRIANQWFTPRNVRLLEDRMVESAQEIVDRLFERDPSEPFDFVTEVATPHPLRLIAKLFGVDKEDEPTVLKITNEVFGGTDPEFARDGDTGSTAASMEDAMAFFGRIMEDRLRDPREDLATVIATATVRGEPIQAVEVLSYYFVLLTAGHDTTRNAIAGGLLALMENPAELERLKKDISLCEKAADEIVRWTTPVNQFARTAQQDYELRGKTIKKGESVALFYASANRDEEIFEDPFAFRVDRDPNPHLGFGIGAHFCLGASLARMEIRVLLEELIPRLVSVEHAGTVERMVSSFVGGVKHLPVRMKVAPSGR